MSTNALFSCINLYQYFTLVDTRVSIGIYRYRGIDTPITTAVTASATVLMTGELLCVCVKQRGVSVCPSFPHSFSLVFTVCKSCPSFSSSELTLVKSLWSEPAPTVHFKQPALQQLLFVSEREELSEDRMKKKQNMQSRAITFLRKRK